MKDDLKISKVEYLRKFWLDIPQMLRLSLRQMKIRLMHRNFENPKFIKEKSAADFFGGPPKINRGS